jgi:hypothetical protein
MKSDLLVTLTAAQVEQQSAESAEMTPYDMPVILIGEADTADIAIGDIYRSYDFALCNADTEEDLGQSSTGFAYLSSGVKLNAPPSGKYQFALRYWLPRNTRFPLMLQFEGVTISNAIAVDGIYQGVAL